MRFVRTAIVVALIALASSITQAGLLDDHFQNVLPNQTANKSVTGFQTPAEHMVTIKDLDTVRSQANTTIPPNRSSQLRAELIDHLQRFSDAENITHSYGDGFTAVLTSTQVSRLTKHPFVETVEETKTVTAFLDNSTRIVNSDEVNNLSVNGERITGAGETVCVIDSGVDYSHQDLGGCSLAGPTNESYVLEPYGSSYPDSTTKSWTIEKEDWHNIQLHFDYVDTEPPSSGVLQDYVYIEGQDEVVVETLSGNKNDVWTPQVPGGNVTVTFVSNSADSDYSGFRIDKIRENAPLKDCSKTVGGYDYVNHDADPADDNGHGTHVAGTIAANNKSTGVAPGSSIYGVKSLDAAGSGTTSDIKAGVNLCTAHRDTFNISVISMSLGGGLYEPPCDSPLGLESAVNDATRHNLTVIAASGNDYRTDDGLPSPACLANVTPVAATNDTDGVTDFSNVDTSVNIAAPGAEIEAPYPGGYENLSGTSMATPHVSAAVALLNQLKSLRAVATEPLNALQTTGVNVSRDGFAMKRIDVNAATSEFQGGSVNASYQKYVSNQTTINFTFQPDGGNLTNVTINGVAAAESNGVFNLTTNASELNLSHGNHTLQPTYAWASNLTSTGSLFLIVDNKPPRIAISPANNATSWLKTVDASVTTTDLTNVTVSSSHNLSEVAVNTTVTVNATDSLGNKNTTSFTYRYENHTDAISIDAPTPTNTYTPTITYGVDNGACNGTVNGESLMSNTSPSHKTTVFGQNNVSVTCSNDIGQTRQVQELFVVDDKAPITTLQTPSPTNTGVINVSVEDDINTSTMYTLDNTTKNYTDPFTINESGTHRITFHSEDEANNSEPNTTKKVTVDKAPPSITITSATAQPTGSKIEITTNITDDTMTNTTITFKNTTKQGPNTTFASQQAGLYQVSVNATDVFNQSNTANQTVNVTTGPYVEPTPRNNTVFGPNVTVSLDIVADNGTITTTCFNTTVQHDASSMNYTCTKPNTSASYNETPPYNTTFSVTTNLTRNGHHETTTYAYQHNPVPPTNNATYNEPLQPGTPVNITTTGAAVKATLLNQTIHRRTNQTSLLFNLPLNQAMNTTLTVTTRGTGGRNTTDYPVFVNTSTTLTKNTTGSPARGTARYKPDDDVFKPFIKTITGLNTSNITLSTDTDAPDDAFIAYNATADTSRRSTATVTVPATRFPNTSTATKTIFRTNANTSLPTTYRGTTIQAQTTYHQYDLITTHFSTFYATVNDTKDNSPGDESDDTDDSGSTSSGSSTSGSKSGGGGGSVPAPTTETTTTNDTTEPSESSKINLSNHVLVTPNDEPLLVPGMETTISLNVTSSLNQTTELTFHSVYLEQEKDINVTPDTTTTVSLSLHIPFNESTERTALPVTLKAPRMVNYTTSVPVNIRQKSAVRPTHQTSVKNRSFSFTAGKVNYQVELTNEVLDGELINVTTRTGNKTDQFALIDEHTLVDSVLFFTPLYDVATVRIVASYKGIRETSRLPITFVNWQTVGSVIAALLLTALTLIILLHAHFRKHDH